MFEFTNFFQFSFFTCMYLGPLFILLLKPKLFEQKTVLQYSAALMYHLSFLLLHPIFEVRIWSFYTYVLLNIVQVKAKGPEHTQVNSLTGFGHDLMGEHPARTSRP